MATVRSKLTRLTRSGIQWICLSVTLASPFVGTAQTVAPANSRTVTADRRLATNGFRPRHLETRWDPSAAGAGSPTLTAQRASTPRDSAATSIQDPRSTAIAQTRTVQTVAQQQPIAVPSVSAGMGSPIVTQPVEALPSVEGSPLDGASAWGQPMVTGPSVVTMGEEGVVDCQSCEQGAGCGGSGLTLLPGVSIDHFSIFGGVHGSKNSSNRGLDGSFGFQEGFNLGTSAKNIILPSHCGLQFGAMAAQSNLGGAGFTVQERNQIFLTTGAFRRSDYGLQGGLVLDYLWDDWYYDLAVGQIRGELSMALSEMNSYGFWFATSVDDQVAEGRIFGNDVTETWDTMDIYSLFYRTNLIAGGTGEAKLFAGLTGGSDGIIGAQSRLPLANGFALETEFTYLIPDETTGFGANEVESWNVAINLAWYPGSLACGNCFRYHRPLFDVANNGSMILRRQ